MAFYLGIDGGGTKTKFLLGNEQQILAEATTAGSNILRSPSGEASVREALHAGVREICGAAGLDASLIVHTVAGIAGSSHQTMRASLMAILQEVLTGDIEVIGDMEIAHYAALEGGPGILVNAGTGSIAYGRNAQGETARSGGWGFTISDEGSGYWIGRVALASAMRRYDADRGDPFLHHLIAALGVNGPQNLAMIPVSRSLSDVFPIVVSIAELGDETAREILKRAGEELADLGVTVVARLFDESEAVSVAASGGVFRSSSIVFESFSKTLAAERAKAQISLSNADPAMGALMLARQHA